MKLRILVVEDRHLVADEIAGQLVALGHEVVGPLAELVPALERARTEPLDAAVLDIHLGQGSVAPVAQALVSRSVPVLFLTGFGTPDSLPEALRSFPLLRKPFGREDLARSLGELFGHRAG